MSKYDQARASEQRVTDTDTCHTCGSCDFSVEFGMFMLMGRRNIFMD